MFFSGAAVDKVRALEKAGVIVTDSPAKIGTEILKVSLLSSFLLILFLKKSLGHEGIQLGLKEKLF